TFFMLSYETSSLRQPYSFRQAVPTEESRQAAQDWTFPVLNLFPPADSRLPAANGAGEWFGRSVRPAGLNVGGARVDQAVGSRVSIFGRYNDSPSNNEFGTLSTNHLDLRFRSLTLGANARPSTNSVVDVRANESWSTADSLWTNPNTPDCALQALTYHFSRDPATCHDLVRFSIGGLGQVTAGREGERRQRQFQLVANASLHRKGQ